MLHKAWDYQVVESRQHPEPFFPDTEESVCVLGGEEEGREGECLVIMGKTEEHIANCPCFYSF